MIEIDLDEQTKNFNDLMVQLGDNRQREIGWIEDLPNRDRWAARIPGTNSTLGRQGRC